MQRLATEPRPNWKQIVEAEGLVWHTDEVPYWSEDRYYAFEDPEAEVIEAATAELVARCYDAVDYAVAKPERLANLGIPEEHHALVRGSWQRQDPDLMGRFDLAYCGGEDTPKLLEYNADTPAALLESAVVQWDWLEGKGRRVVTDADQANSVHEALEAAFTKLAEMSGGGLMHFAALRDYPEDAGTADYVADVAGQCGFEVVAMDLRDIGVTADGQFTDLEERTIQRLWKLYPWEEMLAEPFAANLAAANIAFLEPPWKLVLSSKASLALLHHLFPDHPNILPAELDGEDNALSAPLIRKSFFGRQGTDEPPAVEPRMPGKDYILQAETKTWTDGARHAVIGSWVVAGAPAGLMVRESIGPITTGDARFVPHLLYPPRP